MSSQLFIVSVGGSLINPGQVDTSFLKKFKILIQAETAKGNKFIMVTGGGKLCREYQEALTATHTATSQELDWIGIYATRFNAELVRCMFGKLAHPVVITNPTVKVNFREKILIGAGWKPGWSTDYDTVKLAEVYGAATIVNLSNIDSVYTKDPRKFNDAQKIESISWKDFRKIVGTKWNPGLNMPFDPIASKQAESLGLRVIIANGTNIANLKNIFANKKFIGTEIK